MTKLNIKVVCFAECSTSTSPVEDESSAAATQRLVRRRGNDVTVIKGRGHHSGSHQSADVRHVSHQICTVFTSDLLQAAVVKVTGIAACSWRRIGSESIDTLLDVSLICFNVWKETG